MEVIWERSPLSAQEVIESISPQKDWQAKTVKTLLNRLLKKEILAFKKELEKISVFSPAQPKSVFAIGK